ncbi:MAG: hypothetical protein JRJ20_04365 [Deltaproteobacteria bacterium]|nr:hypothetical protein [Deltaproteobacteria bacterium]
MRHQTVLLALTTWLCLALLSGCGYHFVAEGEPVGINIRSLAIPLMESTSSDLGFESGFTKTIRDEFISHADVPLVSRDKAEMVLIGKIYEIRTRPLTYDITEDNVQGETTYYEVTDSRRLFIRLEVKLLERATGRIIWEEKGMEEKARYQVTEDPLTNRYNQQKALDEIAGRLADRIYLKTMERF